MINSPAMILIGIGGNLASAEYASPRDICEAAVRALADCGLDIVKQSGWFKSKPVPVSSQPWFVNGVVAVKTDLAPTDLLALLLSIEDRFGRRREQANAARTLDLDLIAYEDRIIGWKQQQTSELTVPHQRMHERGFVLLPLHDIAPDWLHPALGLRLDEMIATLDPEQLTLRDK